MGPGKPPGSAPWLPRLGRVIGAELHLRVPGRESDPLLEYEEELLDLDKVRRIEADCEIKGLVNTQSTLGQQRNFAFSISRSDMRYIVLSLCRSFHVESVFVPTELDVYTNLCRFLNVVLYLTARGNLRYHEQTGDWYFVKPANGPPPRWLQTRILSRIYSERVMQFDVIEELTGLDIPEPPNGRYPYPPAPKPKTIHFPVEGYAFDVDRDCLRIRTTDYHADTLVLFWKELLDIADGVGLDLDRGAPS
jgi:hypothetical protein